jgi:hypothetical protein
MFGFSTVGSVGLFLFFLIPLSGALAALYLGLALRSNARRREGQS